MGHYKVVQDEKLDSLVDKVNSNIKAGFEPIGGISDCLVGTNYQGTGMNHIYSQAMIYKGEENE